MTATSSLTPVLPAFRPISSVHLSSPAEASVGVRIVQVVHGDAGFQIVFRVYFHRVELIRLVFNVYRFLTNTFQGERCADGFRPPRPPRGERPEPARAPGAALRSFPAPSSPRPQGARTAGRPGDGLVPAAAWPSAPRTARLSVPRALKLLLSAAAHRTRDRAERMWPQVSFFHPFDLGIGEERVSRLPRPPGRMPMPAAPASL